MEFTASRSYSILSPTGDTVTQIQSEILNTDEWLVDKSIDQGECEEKCGKIS